MSFLKTLGSIAGQALIPIPGVGALAGNVAAGALGDLVSGKKPGLNIPGIAGGAMASIPGVGGALGKALPYVGDAVNVVRGMKPVREREPTVLSKAPVYAQRRNTMDVSQPVANVMAASRGFNEGATSTNAKLAGHSRTLQSLGEIGMQKAAADQQSYDQSLQTEMQIDAQNGVMKDRAITEANQEKMMRENILSQGLSGFARTNQALKAEDNNMRMQVLGVLAEGADMDPKDRQTLYGTVRDMLPAKYAQQFEVALARGQIGAARQILQSAPTIDEMAMGGKAATLTPLRVPIPGVAP